MARDVDRLTERIVREVRKRVLAEVGAMERELDAVFNRAAERIRARLRDVNLASLTRRQVEDLTRDILDEASREAASLASGAMRSAATHGSSAAQQEFQAVFTAAEQATASIGFMTRAERFQVAAERIRGTTTVDNVALSSRIRRNTARARQEMARTIERSIRAGEGLTRQAERLLDLDDLRVEIGQHVTDLTKAARDARALGEPSIFEDVVAGYRRQIDRLGSAASPDFSLRAATEQLVKDLRKAPADQIDRIVERYVIAKAKYQARMVARTETMSAYRDAYVRENAEKPYVHGFRWTLGSAHPHADVCDVLANQDLYGLGPGGYPSDAVPETPHPHDMCTVSAISDAQHFKRELAQLRGTPEPPRDWESGRTESGAAWLARQPEAYQRELLGPTRYAVFQRDPGRVLDESGAPRPVHEVLGRKPRRRAAPAVVRVARPLVQQDRAEGQVRPFPTLPN